MGNGAGNGMKEKPAPGPSGGKRNGLAGRDPQLAMLAKEVESLVRTGMEEARKVPDSRKKTRMMCLVATAHAEVGGDSLPILKEAYEFADRLENPFLSAELLSEIAFNCRITGQDHLSAMARALEKVEREAEGTRKQEALAGIAFSYVKLSESQRAEFVIAKMSSPGFREAVRRAIWELPF